MSAQDPALDRLMDLLAPLGEPAARRMFGAWGVYLDGLMVALVARDTVYLKTDEHNRARFEGAGSEPYVYFKGRSVPTSYWAVPVDALASAEALRPWALDALQAARRKAAEPPRQPRAPRSRLI